MTNKYPEFPKIPRWNRNITITEKIDGTNALIFIDPEYNILAGSRTRWITPQDDNHGFAKWVKENEEELRALGPGHHYGEWWGSGIQRGYGLKEKRLSLFNTHRWTFERPACCHVVPILYEGPMDPDQISQALGDLALRGSWAAEGFKQAEGIMIYHEAARHSFKITLEKDEAPKGKPTK